MVLQYLGPQNSQYGQYILLSMNCLQTAAKLIKVLGVHVYQTSGQLYSFLLGVGGVCLDYLLKLLTSSVSVNQLSGLGI